MSLGQDLLYGVSNGIVRTLKSIFFPYRTKSLTNSTDSINISNCLGHGISWDMVCWKNGNWKCMPGTDWDERRQYCTIEL